VGESTGGLVVNEFIGGLFVTFTLGNLILPFLLDFGLLEFMGDIFRPLMRRLFNVPGRSAVDAVASFVGDGTLGILVTDEQYAQGYYTKREAVLIATSFSVVGIAFASFVAEELGFSDRFALFYGTIVITSFIVAIIIARSPFINRYPMEYSAEAGKQLNEPTGKIHFSDAYDLALAKASTANLGAFKKMIPTIFNIHMTFIPVIVLVGTCGLIIAEYTPFFTWISAPLVPLYQMLHIPDAHLVAKASLVGFADMYLPTIFIKNSPSDMARFIVGTLSFTQLIFMAETGSILLRTRMGFRFLEVLGFFLLRTALSLPIILIIAHLAFR
jgi:nucleoside recognition membrane protein YjiH